MVNVYIAGVNADCVTDPDIRVRVGRQWVAEEGQPSTCAMRLHLSEWDPAIQVGATVDVVEDTGSGRFSGAITDLSSAGHEPDGTFTMNVLATGVLAKWGRRRIGDEPWAAETVDVRAARIATLADETLTVQGGGTIEVVARDVDNRPAIYILAELATSTGAWLYDHAGFTYLQAIDARAVGNPQERWDDQATTWDGWVGMWNEQTETSGAVRGTLHLPPCGVAWEPVWRMSSDIANKVKVLWGTADPQASTSAEDTGSVAQFGLVDVTIPTSLAQLGDAESRAQLVVERSAWPRWHLQSVQVVWDLVDGGTRAALNDLLPGDIVEVPELPQPAPSTAFTGCVEGWDEEWDSTGLRTIRLWLSDIRWSWAVLTWDGIVPDTLTWAAIDCTWDQMLTADDLED